MMLLDKEVNTIDEAFSLLAPEEQEHARRVRAYAEAAFAKIATMDLYLGMPYTERELTRDNVKWVGLGGLYHDIGKLIPDEDSRDGETPKEHTQHGAEIVSELYPDFGKLKATERKLILDGICGHHERMDGSGGPFKKAQREIGYAGRVIAIADILDRRAMVKHSEDPIADVLDEMKKEAADGQLDPEFYRAFRACRAKLKKVFNEYRGDAAAVPVAEPWIRRKSSRPMELKYRRARMRDGGESLWLAQMYFRGSQKNDMTYEDVKPIITAKKLGVKMGGYFLYELCDALRRFDVCGAGAARAAVSFPDTWYTQKRLDKSISQILADEGVPAERIILVIPAGVTEKKTAALEENIEKCRRSGISLVTEAELSELIETETEEPVSEEDIVKKALGESGADG